MADDARAQQIARIEQIERIKALEAKAPKTDASGNGIGAPGAQDVGVTQGATPAAQPEKKDPGFWSIANGKENPDYLDVAGGEVDRWQKVLKHLPFGFGVAFDPAVRHVVGKGMDYVGGPFRVAAAQAAGAFEKGPNPIGMKDYVAALQGNAPHTGDMAMRLGMPNPGFEIPGTNNKRIELKDAVNMVGDTALNPLTYGAAEWAGRKMYNNAIAPVEVMGERFGKSDVGDTMYENGIRSPLDLREKIQAIVDKKMGVARDIERKAAGAGASVDMDKAMAPAQRIASDAATQAVEPSELSLAKRMQRAVDSHRQLSARPAEQFTRELPYTEPELQISQGKPQPEVPVYDAPTESTGNLQQNMVVHRLDAKGKPIVNVKPLKKMPGEPVINNPVDEIRSLPQGNEYNVEQKMTPRTATVLDETEPTLGPSPIQSARMKTAAYLKAKNNAYDLVRRSDTYQNFRKAQGAGLKAETESSIGRALGPEQEAAYRQANEEAGKLLSTGKAQERVGNQAGREFDAATSALPTNTETMTGLVGGHGDLAHGARIAAAIKAMRAIRLMQMPVGSAMRSIPLQDLQLGVAGSQLMSPWRRDENGQEK